MRLIRRYLVTETLGATAFVFAALVSLFALLDPESGYERIVSAKVAAQAPAFTPGTAAVDAPYCSTCGVRMRPAGSCFVCESCGTTSGCS